MALGTRWKGRIPQRNAEAEVDGHHQGRHEIEGRERGEEGQWRTVWRRRVVSDIDHVYKLEKIRTKKGEVCTI